MRLADFVQMKFANTSWSMASKILAGNRSVFYTCQRPYIMLFIHQMTEEEKKKNTFAFRFVFIAIISLTSLI